MPVSKPGAVPATTVPPDQAAGLRRQAQSRRAIHIQCYAASPELARDVSGALYRLGRTTLLIDTQNRLFSDVPARSLFNWQQQCARGSLHLLPQLFGDGWIAPGVAADEPALQQVASRYDQIVFDLDPARPDARIMPGTRCWSVLWVQSDEPSIRHAYALLKTLSHKVPDLSAGLLGDAAACDRVCAACVQFLDPAFAARVYNTAQEVDAIAALAVRMAGAETGPDDARYKIGNTVNMASKHGG